MKKMNKGFTLIELLVVIAVIGILASVVLAALGSSRDKGRDAAVKSDMHTVANQAEIYYNQNSSSYGTAFASGTCPGVTNTGSGSVFYDSVIKQATQQAGLSAGGVAGTTTSGTTTLTACVSNGSSWASAALLKTSTTTAWCVDSSGSAKPETVAANSPAGSYALTAGLYACK